MEQPKVKVSKEISYLDKAFKITKKFVVQLQIDKKDPMYMHAKMVMDEKNFLKDIKKDIKHNKALAEDAARSVADNYSDKYDQDNADMMSDAATFVGDALVKEIKALKKEDAPSSSLNDVVISTYLSNVLKPIDATTELVVNTNKLFLEKEPSVAEQVKVYKEVLKHNPDHETAFILLNIDAIEEPKWLEKDTQKYGKNSLLIKGIRLSYINQPLIQHQIKAIIEASKYSTKPVTILLPMVSTNEEFLVLQNAIKSIWEKEKGTKGVVKTSLLMETPSMVMDPKLVLRNTDMVVLDLDSLVQYTLGIEKDNQLFPELNQPLNASVLRLTRNLILQAKKLNKRVLIQGRSVNEPEVMCALIGIGAKHLTVSRYNVEEANKLAELLNVPATYELIADNAQNPVAGDTQTAIEQYLDSIE